MPAKSRRPAIRSYLSNFRVGSRSTAGNLIDQLLNFLPVNRLLNSSRSAIESCGVRFAWLRKTYRNDYIWHPAPGGTHLDPR